MDNNRRKILGSLLVAFGIIFLLVKLDVLPLTIFFEGWWTLLLIVPALYSMTKQGITTGNSILLAIGLFFFLEERGWNIKGFVVPTLLIIFGIALLLKRR